MKCKTLFPCFVAIHWAFAFTLAEAGCLDPYSVTTIQASSASVTRCVQLIANQLDYTAGNPANNTLANLFAAVPNGTQVQKWNGTGFDLYQKVAGTWPSNPTLEPGEGAYLISTKGPLTVTFSGTARLTATPVIITPGTWYLLSSQFNCPATYAQIVNVPGGGTAAFNGLALYRLKQNLPFNGTITGYPGAWPSAYDIYTYQNGLWYPPSGPPSAAGPLINVGEAVWIGPEPQSVSGMAYEDAGGCSVKAPLPNWQIDLSGTPSAGGTITESTFTDQNGNYFFSVPSGTYTISQTPDPCWVRTCPGSPFTYSITVNPGDQITGEDFGSQPTGTGQDRSVQVYATFPSPYTSPCCNTPMTYHIYYRNGCKAAPNVKLRFVLPPQVIYAAGSASPPETTLSGATTLTWNLGTLSVGALGSITVPVTVKPLGAACSVSPPTLLTATAHILPVTGSGSTFTHKAKVTCSFDPNDKQVSPQGCNPGGLVNNQPLTYTVQFQNVGTGPAFNVIVDDVLDPSLDPSSLQIIGASQNYVLQVNGQEMIWTFPNIYLPDATDDEPDSHGSLTYQVSPLPDLAEGTVITNQAAVYFDNNPPVLTAITTNTITLNPLPVASFTVMPHQGSANQTNDFIYTGGTIGASFLWDFGPNAVPPTSTNINPSGVVFTTEGFQNVTLQVSLGDCVSDAATHLLSVGQPSLQIGWTGSGITLYWSGDGYSLQQAADLTAPILWQTIQPTITSVDGTYFTYLDATNTALFYRLTDQP